MKNLKNKFVNTPCFDFVFCIGNSIAHLESPEDIQDALGQMYSIMNFGATIVLQIINFDRIVKYNISELPIIINNEIGLEFERKYEFNPENGHIKFNTVLKVCNSTLNERFENSIELFPILSHELLEMLKKQTLKIFIFLEILSFQYIMKRHFY